MPPGAHPQRGLYLVAAGTWLACIMPTMVVPFVLPLLTPVVLLPVMLMVPFLERKDLVD